MIRPLRSRPLRSRPLRAAAIGAVLAVAAVLGAASAASAHVRVGGTDATRGGYGVLTFRVPTESATASTTGLTVTFPEKQPLASASIERVPGWTAKVITAKLSTPITTDDGTVDSYVQKIEWTADDAASAIAPGEFLEFPVLAGPLPDAPTMTMDALQTYSDGTTVNWNETSEDGAEPEHPAPVLQLAASSGTTSSAGGHSHGPSATSAPAAAGAAKESGSTGPGPAVGLGIAGLVVGALALLVAIVALLRGTRASRSA